VRSRALAEAHLSWIDTDSAPMRRHIAARCCAGEYPDRRAGFTESALA